MKRAFLLVSVLALAWLAACGAPPQAAAPTAAPPTPAPRCADEAAPFITDARTTLREWRDAMTLAGNTARIALSPQIERLQSLRRTVEGWTPAPCARRVQRLMVDAMNGGIKGYLDFAAQESDLLVQVELDGAREQMDIVERALGMLASGNEPAGPVSLELVRQTFTGRNFEERTLRDGNSAHSALGAESSVEVFGPADDLSHLTFSVSGAPEVAQAAIAEVAGVLAPGWEDHTAWIEANVTDKMGSNATVFEAGMRIVQIRRLGIGADSTYSITFYFV